MSLSISKRTIRAVVLILSVAVATQAALAQSTPPPRPTPTRIDQSTPVRNTPTLVSTPISYETPMRPTPTASKVPPSRATPAELPKPEVNLPEVTLVATPGFLPISGVAQDDDALGSESLLVMAGLVIVCGALGTSIYRKRHPPHL